MFGEFPALYESSGGERCNDGKSVGCRGCWWEASAWIGRDRRSFWKRVTSLWRRRVRVCEWCEIDMFYDAMIHNHLRLENLLFFIMDEADK